MYHPSKYSSSFVHFKLTLVNMLVSKSRLIDLPILQIFVMLEELTSLLHNCYIYHLFRLLPSTRDFLYFAKGNTTKLMYCIMGAP